jgi:hypothetical protein
VKLQKDLREFIELMNSRSVDYLIVGGHAVAFHGYPRYTGDIGFWIRVSPDNASRIAAVLEEFGFGGVGLGTEEFLKSDRVIQLGNPPNRIDVLTGVSGVAFDEAWNTRQSGVLDGLPVSFVSKAVLLKNKRAAGRARDLADVEELTRRRR